MTPSRCLKAAVFTAHLLFVSLIGLPNLNAAAATGNVSAGTIEGRVFNAATGSALPNARVSVVGTELGTLTNERGFFVLRGIPAGEVQIAASYLGLARQTANVTVPVGGVVGRDFELVRGEEDILRMSEYIVAEQQMEAQELAVNERRHAANFKEVVAMGEFGDKNDENIAEFLTFIPGVTVVSDSPAAGTISVRGFPPANTLLTIDGGDFSGSRDGNSRNVALITLPTSNISRVEVTKSPTPDKPASNLGGAVDLISMSGFDVRKPVLAYQMTSQYHNASGGSFDIGAHHHFKGSSPRYRQPSFNLSYLSPINKKLAINAGISRTWSYIPPPDGNNADETPNWDLVKLIQTTSTWRAIAWVTQTWSGDLGADWRIDDKSTLTVRTKYRDLSSDNSRNQFEAIYGAGATGDATHTQGAATGVGSVRMANAGAQTRLMESLHTVVRYERKGDIWHLTANGSRSSTDSRFRDIDRGGFATVPSTITQLVLRGDGIPGAAGQNLPTSYSAVTRTGVPVDVYDGGNYAIDSASSTRRDVLTTRTRAAIDLARDFSFSVPTRVKVGADWRQEVQNRVQDQQSWSFRPNGASDVNSRLARNFDVFDEKLNANFPSLYGRPVRWISVGKVYDLYLQHPDWFVQNEATRHQNKVNQSRRYIETISAAYLRMDLKLLQNKLWLVGGARYEKTNFGGYGPLNDPAARYQRDASGNIVRNASGQPVLITSDALALAKLQYTERGAQSESDFDGLYPSVNATYNFTDRLLLRAAYARTIGRPQISVITPGTTISDPDATIPRITVSNTGLLPWTSNSYDLALEAYMLKDGFGSIGIFQKDIRNFHGTVTRPATLELLAQNGLAGASEYLDYEIVTTTNVGDAKITGLELSYRQFLSFIPRIGKDLQVFGNYSKLNLSGSSTANFDGFVPESLAGGISYIRPRYYVKLTVKYQGDTAQGFVAPSATVPENTYNYLAARTMWGINTQVSLNKRLSFFASCNDFKGGTTGDIRYAPGTPDYAKPRRVQEVGYFITYGIRGEF